MSKAKEVIEAIESQFSTQELTAGGIKKEFHRVLDRMDIDGVTVDNVDIDPEGDITVSFVDDEGDQLDVAFVVDDEEDSIVAVVVDDEQTRQTDDDDVITIDLTAMNPSILKIPGVGAFVNLSDLQWVNKSALLAILKAGEVGTDATNPNEKPRAMKRRDAYGNTLPQDQGELSNEEFELVERMATVIRGGKKVKLPVVKKRRKKRLSSKQKAGIRKAVLKRKSKKQQTQRKRKRSLRLRKQSGLKNKRKGTKVKG